MKLRITNWKKSFGKKKYGKKDQNITPTTNTSNNSTTSSNGNSTATNSGSSNSNSNNSTYQNSGAQNKISNTANNQQLSQQQLDEQFFAKQNANRAAYDAKIADQTQINNFQKNYETGQQIGNVVVGLANLFTPSEYTNEREKFAKEVELETRRKEQLLQLREGFFKIFPDGAIPLSSHKINGDELYFFSYVFDKSTINNAKPVIKVSNVFPLARYGDGTWPLKSSITAEISKLANSETPKLVGYYSTLLMAEEMRSSFLNHSSNCSFVVQDITYKGKKSSGTKENNDFWETEIKEKKTTEKSKPEVKKEDDFWNE